MDIAGLSMAISTQNVLSDVSVAVLKNSLDTMEDLGNGVNKMIMEASVTPYLGQNIDYSIWFFTFFLSHFLFIEALAIL